MKLKQLSIFLAHNTPGTLAGACRLLADNGINLYTLALADTKDFGILRIIVKDVEKAESILRGNNYMVKATDVVAVKVEDRPGGMCSILETLEKNSINVEYMYAFTSNILNGAVIIFRFDSPDDAISKLGSSETVSFVSPDDIFGK